MITISGIDILFTLDGTLVACAAEADISIQVEMLEARQPDGDKSRNFIPDKIVAIINISGALTFEQRAHIYTPLDDFAKVTFNYHTADSGDGGFSGSCWVQSWGESSPTNTFARYNASFIIDGLPVFISSSVSGSHWIDELTPSNILTDEAGNQFTI